MNPIKNKKNLNISLSKVVTKILFDQKKAIGVECISNGNVEKYFANEVILTAVALISPTILMH